MTLETIYGEMKKMGISLLPHLKNDHLDSRPLIAHHHLELSLFYLAQYLKSPEYAKNNPIEENNVQDTVQ